jgi:hypothetical protein
LLILSDANESDEDNLSTEGLLEGDTGALSLNGDGVSSSTYSVGLISNDTLLQLDSEEQVDEDEDEDDEDEDDDNLSDLGDMKGISTFFLTIRAYTSPVLNIASFNQLASKDPSFFKYLQENDPELLKSIQGPGSEKEGRKCRGKCQRSQRG